MTLTTASSTPATASGRGRQPAVSIERVSKSFKLPHRQYHTLKERVLHPFATQTYDVLRAVDEVSLEVGTGEFFGIIGRNGSGKSTLLKCMAGIYAIDSGRLRVSGRLSPFIELGVGFNPELTARDNVMINAIMLGLSRREARARFDQIIEFAELEDFLDMRLKNYSSGMHVRLAFSVAIQVDAEILLIDEVLAVGDARFQQKCFDEFFRLKNAGRTILFVTHDMSAVERFCDRAMLLDKGRMIGIGEPAAIARRYNELNFGQTIHALAPEPQPGADGAAHKEAQIVDAWFEDEAGARIAAVGHRETATACVEVHFHAPVEDPIFGATLRNDVGATVFATTSALDVGPTGRFEAGETVVARLRIEMWFTQARYTLTPSVARAGLGADAIDLRPDLASVVVHGGNFTTGVVDLPHTFDIERL